MKYLVPMLFLFGRLYPMDPMDIDKRCHDRAVRFAQFVEVMHELQRDDMAIDPEPDPISPLPPILMGSPIPPKSPLYLQVEENDGDYIMLDRADFE